MRHGDQARAADARTARHRLARKAVEAAATADPACFGCDRETPALRGA